MNKGKMEPLISIIIATYNSEETVEETIQSLISQTYSNIEIILTDDNSVDGTVKICKEYACHDNRIKILENSKNIGIPANINRGIRVSHGKLLKISVGADDRLKSNSIGEYYKAYLSTAGEKILYQSKVDIFGDDLSGINEVIKYCKKSYDILQSADNQTDDKYELKMILDKDYIVAPGVGLIERDIFDKYGLLDERFPAFEDWPYWCKLLDRGYHFKLLDKTLVDYRVSGKSSSSNVSGRFIESLLSTFFLNNLKIILKNHFWHLLFSKLLENTKLYLWYKLKYNTEQ